ncbi:ankyrin repeat domain-containing protein [Hydrogenophaga sp.]|uniref:ankyrin repeat domain-containing protein n=1 Tax=Hydrogenophaga sp. TaxID=1904254 RepID=UPI003F6EC461
MPPPHHPLTLELLDDLVGAIESGDATALSEALAPVFSNLPQEALNLRAHDGEGNNLAHLAASLGHTDLINLLGEEDWWLLNEFNRDREFPGHCAARGEHVDVLKALAEWGASLPEWDADWPSNVPDEQAQEFQRRVDGAALSVAIAELEQRETTPAQKNLASDLQCPVTLAPYTLIGPTRPVRLPTMVVRPDGVPLMEPVPGSVLSACAAERILAGFLDPRDEEGLAVLPVRDPLTNQVLSPEVCTAFMASDAFRDGDPLRMALVQAALEVYQTSCDDVEERPDLLINSCLLLAIRTGDRARMDELLEGWKGSLTRTLDLPQQQVDFLDDDAAYGEHHSLTTLAARYGRLEILDALRVRQADIHAPNGMKDTPAHIAARYGKVDVLRQLHAWGADFTATTDDGYTPAHYAAEEGQVTVFDLYRELSPAMRERGHDPVQLLGLNARLSTGETPADLAHENGHTEVLNQLSLLGANVDVSRLLPAPAHYLHVLAETLTTRGAGASAADVDQGHPRARHGPGM